MRVMVVGAGIVGCSTAYALQRQGYQVTLLDAQVEVGRMSSYANGAQLSYSYVEPLASDATLRALPGLLLAKDSALKFSPRWDTQQWAWGIQFLAACTRSQAQNGTRQLLELAALSRRTLESWMEEEHWSIDFARNGKLVLCRDEATLRRQEAQVALQAKLGSSQEVLNAKQCAEREPALSHIANSFAGGIWTESECVANPYLLCQQLANSFVERGGKLALGQKVTAFERQANRVQAVHTEQGSLPCDAVVIAAGVASPRLGAMLGMKLPIYPIKGYSITVPVINAEKLARCSITDLGLKTVFAPLGQHLRVAAAAEIVGEDLHIDPKRIAQMLHAVNELFPGACDLSAPQTWAGLRPATPNSLPIIGQAGGWASNAWANAGQGALGLTLAAGSAARLASAL
ncbi:MAG: FAD-dependent oxidoreductase [Brachymonas sp.]|nr:FAD-dependent oxidoreductase [Brachymonas sp.]